MSLAVLEDIENCFSGGWSDGLPVIPPYGSLVDPMLEAMGWQHTDVVGEIKEQNIEVLAEQVAASAVMAGCKYEYAPLLRSLAEAMLDPAFHLSGVEVTTGGASALVIVSGPVVEKLGFAHKENALGANVRANATVGRFAQMLRFFLGRGGGVLDSHGTMGHPGRLSFCVAEHPETLWPSFHTQRGLKQGDSVVSVMSSEGPNSVNNHYGKTGKDILDTIAHCMGHAGTTNYYWRIGCYLVVLGPGHAELIARDFTRDEARRYLYEHAVLPTDELIRLGRIADDPIADSKVEPGTMRSPFDREKQIFFIESGGTGGKFSAVIPGWAGNAKIISRKINI